MHAKICKFALNALALFFLLSSSYSSAATDSEREQQIWIMSRRSLRLDDGLLDRSLPHTSASFSVGGTAWRSSRWVTPPAAPQPLILPLLLLFSITMFSFLSPSPPYKEIWRLKILVTSYFEEYMLHEIQHHACSKTVICIGVSVVKD